MTSSLANYLLLILLAAIFGSNFMMTKISVAEIEPLWIVGSRLALAAVVLVIVMLIARSAWPKGQVWIWLVLTAIFGHALPYFLITWGQEVVDAGLSAIFMAIMPLFTILIAHLVTDDEKLSRWVLMGFALAFAGVVVLFGVDKLASFDGTSLRQYALLGAALCYGVNAVMTKKLTGLAWQSMAAIQVGLAVCVTLPVILVISPPLPIDVSTKALVALLYTGIMPTAVGAIMVLVLIRRAGAAFLSQINFLVPLFGTAFAIVFLGEHLPANAAIALLLILAGVALARWRPNREPLSINRGA